MKKRRSTLRAIRKMRVAIALAIGVALIPAGTAHAAAPTPTGMTTMFVTSATASAQDVADAKAIVTYVGGKVLREFDVPGTFLAEVPNGATWAISSTLERPDHTKFYGCTASMSEEQRAKFLDQQPFNAALDGSSLENVPRAMNADKLWAQGVKGKGVGVAIIDTGVAPVGPLATASLAGPDISFDSQTPELAHNDGFGHGTHLAGIINAVAPEAKVINVKVGDMVGANDVTQVIAAIDWVREHKDDPALGAKIKVLNLSYGLVSANTWQADELSRSVQAAWDAGITVVVSAGNGGASNAKSDPGVLAPAYDKSIIAVANYDTGANPYLRTDDKANADSSGASSSNKRMPDFSAPGTSIASYHVVGSLVDDMVTNYFCNPQDENYKPIPYPIVDNGRLVRGSGTSQAAAAASGAIALLAQKYPTVTPDVIRLQLRQSVAPIPNGNRTIVGEGALDLLKATTTTWPTRGNSFDTVTGGAPIAATRNTLTLVDHVKYDQVYNQQYPGLLETYSRFWPQLPDYAKSVAASMADYYATEAAKLDGDRDIFGQPFSAATHANLLNTGQKTWTMTPDGEAWNGSVMIGTGVGKVVGSPFDTELLGSGWRKASWSGSGWRGSGWRGATWSGSGWRGSGWRGSGWRDSAWSGSGWRGSGWREIGWSSVTWG